jgi:hypothetical protein
MVGVHWDRYQISVGVELGAGLFGVHF